MKYFRACVGSFLVQYIKSYLNKLAPRLCDYEGKITGFSSWGSGKNADPAVDDTFQQLSSISGYTSYDISRELSASRQFT